MDVIALVISGLSLLAAGAGTLLANIRATEALAESRKASAAALWSGIQEAVQRLIGFDPASEPIGERLANLRIAMITLVDELEDWSGLDKWLEAERALGAVLGRQVMETARPVDTVAERLQALDPFQRWGQALGSNLRRFRSEGYDPDAADRLRRHALDLQRRICEAHGWPLPPSTTPGPTTLR